MIEGASPIQRAAKIFQIDEREVAAASHWEIVVWRRAGHTHFTVRGPETKATAVRIPKNAEFFGVQFKLSAFMPDLPVSKLVNRDLTLPSGGGNSFRLNGSAWEIPDYENVDVFLSRLAREGLITSDPVVMDALRSRPIDLSQRSVERRVRRATGLTLGAIRQITRAEKAVALLDRGTTIADTIAEAGYADQAHLTRALKRFMGQTPARIAKEAD